MIEDVGKNIRRLRTNLGLKQSDLANIVGVSAQAISSYENNRTEPNMGMVMKLKDALKCSTSDIIGINEYTEDNAHILAQIMKQPHLIPVMEDLIKLPREKQDAAAMVIKQMTL